MKKRSLEEPVRKRPSVYFVDPAVDLTKIRVIENRKKVIILHTIFTDECISSFQAYSRREVEQVMDYSEYFSSSSKSNECSSQLS